MDMDGMGDGHKQLHRRKNGFEVGVNGQVSPIVLKKMNS